MSSCYSSDDLRDPGRMQQIRTSSCRRRILEMEITIECILNTSLSDTSIEIISISNDLNSLVSTAGVQQCTLSSCAFEPFAAKDLLSSAPSSIWSTNKIIKLNAHKRV